MDPLQKRRLMKSLAEGKGVPEDLQDLKREEGMHNYGEVKEISRKEFDSGINISCEFNGGEKKYYIPKYKSWISGEGIQLEEAYLVTFEGEEKVVLREVMSPFEIGAIKEELKKEI